MIQEYDPKTTADEVLAGVDLKGKRFLITGASSGIGLETARSLVSHGASVIGAVRNLAKAESATAPVRDAALQGASSRKTNPKLVQIQSWEEKPFPFEGRDEMQTLTILLNRGTQ